MGDSGHMGQSIIPGDFIWDKIYPGGLYGGVVGGACSGNGNVKRRWGVDREEGAIIYPSWIMIEDLRCRGPLRD